MNQTTIDTLLQLKSGEEIAKILVSSYITKTPILPVNSAKVLVKHLDKEQKKIFEIYIYLWLSFKQLYSELATNIVQIERDFVVIREIISNIHLYYTIKNKLTGDLLQYNKIQEILSILSDYVKPIEQNTLQRVVERFGSNQIFLEYVFGMYNGIKLLSEKVNIPLYKLLQPIMTSLEITIKYFNNTLSIVFNNEEVCNQYPESIHKIQNVYIESYKKTQEFKEAKQMLKTGDILKTDLLSTLQIIYAEKYKSVFTNKE